jgi:hypothetical protein
MLQTASPYVGDLCLGRVERGGGILVAGSQWRWVAMWYLVAVLRLEQRPRLEVVALGRRRSCRGICIVCFIFMMSISLKGVLATGPGSIPGLLGCCAALILKRSRPRPLSRVICWSTVASRYVVVLSSSIVATPLHILVPFSTPGLDVQQPL